MSEILLSGLVNTISTQANEYANHLNSLKNQASNGNSLDMATTVVSSTEVQVSSAILEMAQGVVKNATDQVKKSGSNISR